LRKITRFKRAPAIAMSSSGLTSQTQTEIMDAMLAASFAIRQSKTILARTCSRRRKGTLDSLAAAGYQNGFPSVLGATLTVGNRRHA